MIVTTSDSNIPIAANVVIGTNIFSDIGASFGDLLMIVLSTFERENKFNFDKALYIRHVKKEIYTMSTLE